ncbi:MAG: DUF2264 domain-containing protein [Clostridia bacterium]|nr:DUF2264 domain-containing protein [Clostridia bacterium]
MTETRKYWLDTMLRIATPVLGALSEDRLKETMPIEGAQPADAYRHCTYLEAFGRTLCGIAPWLGCRELQGREETLRLECVAMAQACLDHATDPGSRDCMNFANGMQPIVDAAFLAQGILRAPHVLWDPLPERVKDNILNAMRQTRTRKPGANNWLLFSAMIECLIRYAGAPDWDPMRIDYAVKQHLQWYKGDGVYGDGAPFHWDYYNSYVIQPMLYEIVKYTVSEYKDWESALPAIRQRLSHYGAIQEHLISPEGTYPLLGRSLCYRFGAFQSLSLAAYEHILEDTVTPAGVRCGLSAVMRRLMSFPDMFGERDFLRVGVCGYQPGMGEPYISTGSLYLCCAVFLPLGLPESDPFWSDPDADWTGKSLWAGKPGNCEHAIS